MQTADKNVIMIFSSHTPQKQSRDTFPKPDLCVGNKNQTDIQFQFSITLFPASPRDGWDGEKKIGYRVVKDILLYYIVLQDKNNEVSHREAEWGSLT